MGETLFRIGQASQNENLEPLHGAKGDQSGSELNAVKYFDYPWLGIWRCDDPEIADGIATFMEKAIANGCIGYDYNTNKRYTLFTELEKVEFKVDELLVPCYADCSTLAYCAIYAVTGVKFTPIDDANGTQFAPKSFMYENYINNDLIPAGFNFTYITDVDFKLTVNNSAFPAELKRGDIFYADGHIAVWL